VKRVYPSQVNELNLTRLIQEFVHGQQYPESSPRNISNLPPFYEKITIHTSSVGTFHAPSDLSGIAGMKRERIHAVDGWRKGPGRYDTLFINTGIDDADQDEDSPSLHGFLSLEVARARLFFSFVLDGVNYPCALVHWYTRTSNTPSDVTGMYVVEPEYLPNGQPAVTVVHLDTIYRAAHLLPVFLGHPPLGKHQRYEDTLDLFPEFYVNKYIDHHAFEVVT
jgi:hypothetical protein